MTQDFFCACVGRDIAEIDCAARSRHDACPHLHVHMWAESRATQATESTWRLWSSKQLRRCIVLRRQYSIVHGWRQSIGLRLRWTSHLSLLVLLVLLRLLMQSVVSLRKAPEVRKLCRSEGIRRTWLKWATEEQLRR